MQDLTRYLEAQDTAGTYQGALAEIGSGHKQSHWMWYIFPQVIGLGKTPTAQFYAIQSIQEARGYLQHEVLAERLSECVQAMLMHGDKTAIDILGGLDGLKFRSSMTLFWRARAEDSSIFELALEQFYEGQRCIRTLEILDCLIMK